MRSTWRNRRAAPSLAHWFGTDDLGRDTFSRALFGGRVSIAIGLLSALVAAGLGVAVGAVAGYVGGWTDTRADARAPMPCCRCRGCCC